MYHVIKCGNAANHINVAMPCTSEVMKVQWFFILDIIKSYLLFLCLEKLSLWCMVWWLINDKISTLVDYFMKFKMWIVFQTLMCGEFHGLILRFLYNWCWSNITWVMYFMNQWLWLSLCYLKTNLNWAACFPLFSLKHIQNRNVCIWCNTSKFDMEDITWQLDITGWI